MRFQRATTGTGSLGAFAWPTLVVLAIVATAVLAWSSRSAVRSRSSSSAVTLPPTTVAVVNGVPLGEDDVAIRLDQLLPFAAYHGNVDSGRLMALRRAALDELVLDELIYREALQAGRMASDASVADDLAEVKARFGDEAQFAAALAENGLTESAFRERVARAIIVREARAERARQHVTDDDVTSYYRANGRMFEHPEAVHLLEILIRRDPADPGSAVAAERTARTVLARLQQGAAFHRLARERSEDEYRVKGGDMGFVHRGRLDAAFEQAVFAAPVGRFQLAETLYGFEVFKVVARRAARQLSLEEARPIILERLQRLRRESALRAWHRALLAGARVEIRDAALRAARAAEIPEPITGGRIRPVARNGGRP